MRKIFLFGLLSVFLLSFSGSAFAAAKSDVTPDAALKMLQEGNGRFVAAGPKRPNQNAKRRVETAVKGQKPFAAVLSSADSRGAGGGPL